MVGRSSGFPFRTQRFNLDLSSKAFAIPTHRRRHGPVVPLPRDWRDRPTVPKCPPTDGVVHGGEWQAFSLENRAVAMVGGGMFWTRGAGHR